MHTAGMAGAVMQNDCNDWPLGFSVREFDYCHCSLKFQIDPFLPGCSVITFGLLKKRFAAYLIIVVIVATAYKPTCMSTSAFQSLAEDSLDFKIIRPKTNRENDACE